MTNKFLPWKSGPLSIDGLLNWVFGDCQAHKVTGSDRQSELMGAGHENWAAVSLSGLDDLGTTIDTSAGAVSPDLHPVCYFLDDLLGQFGPARRGFVLDYAISGTRPETGQSATPKIRPVNYKTAGMSAVEVTRNHHRKSIGDYCPIRISGTGDGVQYERARWMEWARLLGVIRVEVVKAFPDIALSAVDGPRWSDDDISAGVMPGVRYLPWCQGVQYLLGYDFRGWVAEAARAGLEIPAHEKQVLSAFNARMTKKK